MQHMQVGDDDGRGRYGILNEDADGLLCHECGQHFTHLGLHAYKAHGLTAKEYRAAHGLGRRGLVAETTRRALADNARKRYPTNALFVQRRDPAGATAARLGAGKGFHSPAGLEAMRQASTGQGARQHLGTVVACELCGVEFCPLLNAKRRRFCSYSCSSRHTRARQRLGADGVARLDELREGGVRLSARPRPRPGWTWHRPQPPGASDG